MAQALVWWLAAQGLGWLAAPVTARVFRALPDRGYAFSKAAGLLLVSYGLWLGASVGAWRNDLTGIWISIAILAALSAWIALRGGAREAVTRARQYLTAQGRGILVTEALFLLAFALWAAVRAFTPDKIVHAYGEKYMEIAFLNGVLRSPAFPPQDPWLAGFPISYYYFGYVMMALLVRLTGTSAFAGFELFDALLFALAAVSAYGVVSNLIRAAGGSGRAGAGFGLLGAVFTCVLGSLEGLLHSLRSAGLLPDALTAWLDIPGLSAASRTGSLYPGHDFYRWWWWAASRGIHDLDLTGKPLPYQPITEFPLFSFILGDNHPHKMALPFVLMVVGLALNLALAPEKTGGWTGRLGRYAFASLAVGALGFLNTWDLPTFGLLCLAGIGMRRLRATGRWREAARAALATGLAGGLACAALYAPFYRSFTSQAAGVLPQIFPPTRAAQLVVLFGPFLALQGLFLARAVAMGGRAAAKRMGIAWGGVALLTAGIFFAVLGVLLALFQAGLFPAGVLDNPHFAAWTGGAALPEITRQALAGRLASPGAFLILSLLAAAGAVVAVSPARMDEAETSTAARFAGLLASAGCLLVLSVEFFYLRDTFGLRMNTVFKVYYQAWVLMACASAYGCWWLFQGVTRPARKAGLAVVVGILTTAGLVYPVLAVTSRVHALAYAPTLDASATLAGRYPGHWNAFPDDWAGIRWLLENAPASTLLVEAPGGAYEHAGRMSAFTGFPTLLGWSGHEAQWRAETGEITRRQEDLRTLYTTSDGDLALSMLREWKVTYVIVGSVEMEYITKACAEANSACSAARARMKFEQVLRPVFRQGSLTIYKVP